MFFPVLSPNFSKTNLSSSLLTNTPCVCSSSSKCLLVTSPDSFSSCELSYLNMFFHSYYSFARINWRFSTWLYVKLAYLIAKKQHFPWRFFVIWFSRDLRQLLNDCYLVLVSHAFNQQVIGTYMGRRLKASLNCFLRKIMMWRQGYALWWLTN